MAKVLYSRSKEFDHKGKKKFARKARKYYVSDDSRDFHCNEGIVSKEDLAKEDGTVIASNKGHEFVVFNPQFTDEYARMTRGPQMIPLKDIGLILTTCGLNKDSVVMEAGVGSGGLGVVLSSVCKKVISYEIREDHIEVAEKNKRRLNLENWEIKQGDITEDVSEEGFDTIVLDMPNPWDAKVGEALKVGGYLVSYSPSMPQVMDFVENVGENFEVIKTVRVMEEEWEVYGRKVRPISGSIIHSGFLTFVRKVA